jgi:hypothetical protein
VGCRSLWDVAQVWTETGVVGLSGMRWRVEMIRRDCGVARSPLWLCQHRRRQSRSGFVFGHGRRVVNTPRRGLSPGAASTEGKRVITSQLSLPTGLTGLLLSIATKGWHGDEEGMLSLSVSPSSPSSSSALGNLIPAQVTTYG